jgi:hypothetical protein
MGFIRDQETGQTDAGSGIDRDGPDGRDPFQQSELKRVRSWLQENHVEWICSRPGCMITDIAEIRLGQDGKETRNSLIYRNLPEGFRLESWEWEFDTRGTYRPGSLTRMEVRAIEWS